MNIEAGEQTITKALKKLAGFGLVERKLIGERNLCAYRIKQKEKKKKGLFQLFKKK